MNEDEVILRQLKIELDENLHNWDWRIHSDVIENIYLMGDCNYSKGITFNLSINYTIHQHEALRLSSNNNSAYDAIRKANVGDIPLSDPECFKKAVRQVQEVLMVGLQNTRMDLIREWLAVTTAIERLNTETKGGTPWNQNTQSP